MTNQTTGGSGGPTGSGRGTPSGGSGTRTEPGYRGALPTRQDRLGRPWVLIVIGIFLLIIVLSILGVPSRFIPDPTPVPLPSVPASSSIEPLPSGSAAASPSGSAETSPSGAASPSGSASVSPSPSPSP